jgi:methylamine dehydrogenase accessory protein MauD
MTPTLAVCLSLQWILLLCLIAVVLALARQVGILHERVAPLGALMIDSGPKVGDVAPHLALTSIDGTPVSIGKPQDKSTLLFFLSPDCPVCKKLLPVLSQLRRAEQSWLQLVYASDGERSAHEALAQSALVTGVPYLLSPDLGRRFQVGRLPHAVLIGADGRVRAKGLVNSREQLESLITASELAVASVQEFLKRREADLRRSA